MTKGKQGFASMHPNRVITIARMGGKAQGAHNNPGNFKNDPDKARRAGQAGGRKSRRSPEDRRAA
jgi:general stress protein YciG